MLVAKRPIRVSGGEVAPGQPLPADLGRRVQHNLRAVGWVEEVEPESIDIDALLDGAEHKGFGRWLLPNGMRVQSKKSELRATVRDTLEK